MSKKAVTACALLLAIQSPVLWADPKDEDEEEPTLVYGETVVVTSSRADEVTVADSPVSITVVGPQQLESTPADNYADLLRGVPGLNVIQTSARDFNFTSRGATSTLSTGQLAMVDGRSVYLDFFGFVMWDLLPVAFDEVASIEVVRGPGSAVWGANALNGVINVRTKGPRELAGGGQSGSAMFRGGEVGTLGGAARWAKATSDRLSYKISASYFEQDPWPRADTLPSGEPLPPGADYANSGTQQPKLDFRLDYLQDEAAWTFEGGAAGTSGIILTGIGPFDVKSETFFGYGKVAYHRGPTDFQFYVNRLDGDARNLLNGLPFEFKTWVVNADVSDRRPIGQHQVLVYGGSARGNFFDLSIAPLDDQRTELGAFVEDQIVFNDMFRANVGLRLDWFDTIGTTFSPRTSLIVSPHRDHTIRVAYNRAYRAPSLVQNYLATVIPNAIELPTGQPYVFPTEAIGNPDLSEETIDAVELAYTVNIKDRTTIGVAVYRNETKELTDFFPAEFYSAGDPPPDWPLPPAFVPPNSLPKLFTYRNIGKVIDKGVELSADVRVRPGVNVIVTYAWQDRPDVSADELFNVNIPAENQFSAAVNFARDIWQGSVGVTYTDKAFWTDVLDQRFWGETDSYTLLNASLGVRLADRLELAFNGTNLTDAAAQQHAFGDIIGRKVTGEVRVGF